jgi:hypothetical protein
LGPKGRCFGSVPLAGANDENGADATRFGQAYSLVWLPTNDISAAGDRGRAGANSTAI